MLPAYRESLQLCLKHRRILCTISQKQLYSSASTSNTALFSPLLLLCRSRIGGRVPSRGICAGFRQGLLDRGDRELLEASQAAEKDCGDVAVLPEFVTAGEGECLLREIERGLRGKRYLYNHWDGVSTAS